MSERVMCGAMLVDEPNAYCIFESDHDSECAWRFRARHAPAPVTAPTPPETAKGWGCGCPQDFKHTACPLHAKSDVYLIVSPAPVRGLDFEKAHKAVSLSVTRYAAIEAHLNAQHLAALEGVRKERNTVIDLANETTASWRRKHEALESRHATLRALVGEWQEARKREGVKDMAETLRFAGACQALAAWEAE